MIHRSSFTRSVGSSPRRRRFLPRLDRLEERVTPAASLTPLVALTAYAPVNASLGGDVVDAPAVDAAGDLFVAISLPGTGSGGTAIGEIVEVPKASPSSPQALAGFYNVNGTNDGNPDSQMVIDANGDLFGTTSSGFVFELPKGATQISIVGFVPGGTGPAGFGLSDLTLANGVLYGVVALGGDNSFGAVYSVPAQPNSTVHIIASFTSATGVQPNGGLFFFNGLLFGTTQFGGQNNKGVVYYVPDNLNDGAVTDLASFNATRVAASANDQVVVENGVVYGTLFQDPSSPTNGAVFYVSLLGGGVQTLPLTSATGTLPTGGLVLDGTVIAGIAATGGANSMGTVFTVNPVGKTFGPTLSFSTHDISGGGPYGGLTLDSAGDVLGVCVGTTAQTIVFWQASGLQAPVTHFDWTGNGNTAAWSNPNNWLQGVAPPASNTAVTLSFPAGAKQAINVDDIPGLTVAGISITGPYVMGGLQSIGVYGNITMTAAAGAGCVLQMPLSLKNVSTVTSSAGNVLNLAGTLTGGTKLTLVGPGVITVPFANTLSSNVVIQSGIIQVFNGNAFGSGQVNLNGGQIEVGGFNLTIPNVIFTAGNTIVDGNAQSSVTFTNTVLADANSVLIVNVPSITFQGAVTGIAGVTLTTIGTGFTNFENGVYGHVQIGTKSDLSGNLGPDAIVDIRPGTQVSAIGTLTGSGAINVNGQFTAFSTAKSPAFKAYIGTLTLQPAGTLITSGTLSIGKLVLAGGTVQLTGNTSFTIATTFANSLTTPVVVVSPGGAFTVTFGGVIIIPSDDALLLNGATVDFGQDVVFGQSVLLSVGGAGTIAIPKAQAAQINRLPGSHVTITPF